jgi:hypothetical protein
VIVGMATQFQTIVSHVFVVSMMTIAPPSMQYEFFPNKHLRICMNHEGDLSPFATLYAVIKDELLSHHWIWVAAAIPLLVEQGKDELLAV